MKTPPSSFFSQSAQNSYTQGFLSTLYQQPAVLINNNGLPLFVVLLSITLNITYICQRFDNIPFGMWFGTIYATLLWARPRQKFASMPVYHSKFLTQGLPIIKSRKVLNHFPKGINAKSLTTSTLS